MSSFLWKTERFLQIKEPERFFQTNWLQSYIHILCAAGENSTLGLIAGPCVGAGIYMNVPNFDIASVDGVNYRKMLEFAIEHGGFDEKQLEQGYIKRLCLLASHGIVKERAAGVRKVDLSKLFLCSWRYPTAWVKLYPFFFIPSFLCRYAAKRRLAEKGKKTEITINRLD